MCALREPRGERSELYAAMSSDNCQDFQPKIPLISKGDFTMFFKTEYIV